MCKGPRTLRVFAAPPPPGRHPNQPPQFVATGLVLSVMRIRPIRICTLALAEVKRLSTSAGQGGAGGVVAAYSYAMASS
jgi:hypothetical protein